MRLLASYAQQNKLCSSIYKYPSATFYDLETTSRTKTQPRTNKGTQGQQVVELIKILRCLRIIITCNNLEHLPHHSE